MAEHIVDKIEYNSEVYKFQDNVSGYAPLASPALTGTPTAPTASNGDSSTKIATTAFVQNAMSAAGAGTVTSVGVSNATNGGLSVSGSPITSNGTITVGHSNVLTNVQNTQAVYPVKIDKNGHISAYGTAVTRGTAASGGTTLSLVNTGDMYTWNNKQDALVSGTNIKTINNTSLLGSGNVNTVAAQIIRW